MSSTAVNLSMLMACHAAEGHDTVFSTAVVMAAVLSDRKQCVL